jgi:hypothetical protein
MQDLLSFFHLMVQLLPMWRGEDSMRCDHANGEIRRYMRTANAQVLLERETQLKKKTYYRKL